MPIIKSAEKKMRQDVKRTKLNRSRKDTVKSLIKSFRKNPNIAEYKKVQSAIDKLAKVKTIHKNKADRLKSRLMKFMLKSGKTTKETGEKKVKTKKTKTPAELK